MPFISKTYNVTWNKKIPVQQKDWIVLSNLLFCSFHPSNVGLNVPFLETKAPGHLFDCFFLIPFKRWTSLSWPRALWLVCQSIQPLFNQWTLTMWHASALCFLLDAWRIPIRVLGWKCPAPVKLHASEWMSMRHSWRAAWNKLDDLKIDKEGGFRRWKIRSPFFDLSERRDSRPEKWFFMPGIPFESLILPCIHDFFGIQGMLAANFKLPKTLRGFAQSKEMFRILLGFLPLKPPCFWQKNPCTCGLCNETPDVWFEIGSTWINIFVQ